VTGNGGTPSTTGGVPATGGASGGTGGLAYGTGGASTGGVGGNLATGGNAATGGVGGGVGGAAGTGGTGGSGPIIVEADPACDPIAADLWDFSVEITGTGFDADEGLQVFAGSEMRYDTVKGKCVTYAEATVVDGSFHFVLHGSSDGASYPTFGVYIDEDDNDSCNTSSDYARWAIGTATAGSTLVQEFTPETPEESGASCLLFKHF
jgi:hypothetical protein